MKWKKSHSKKLHFFYNFLLLCQQIIQVVEMVALVRMLIED